MEADSPPSEDNLLTNEEEQNPPKQEQEVVEEVDTTIHPFNVSNVTVIENENSALQVVGKASGGGAEQKLLSADGPETTTKKISQCEGSDSGVEVVEGTECTYQRNLSSNSAASQDFNCARSCASSILSYEEAYNILLRKNSTLLEDYGRNDDVTSENGSESSSISGPRTNRRTQNNAKKKLSPTDARKTITSRDRSKSKPPSNSKSSVRLKSIDRLQGKSQSAKVTPTRTAKTPNTLELPKKETKRQSSASVRTSSTGRVPSATPTDDGRWPSIHSRPAPLMSRSLKGQMDTSVRGKLSQMDTKTIEKYATLPRRSKEKSELPKKNSSRENTLQRIAITRRSSRETPPSKMTSSLYLPRSKQKVKIYHELGAQTALTMTDLDNALAGLAITPKSPVDVETLDREVHVDMTTIELERLQHTLVQVTEQFETLKTEHRAQNERLRQLEERLKEESLEKEGLKEELRSNTERVMAILGGEGAYGQDLMASSSDSLMALECRFQTALQSLVHQEEEISRLHAFCRTLQMEVDRANATRDTLMRHQREVEAEAAELQDFMQAEKTTLHDALREAEAALEKKEAELKEAREECSKLSKLSEQRRQENVSLQARLGVLESKSRELLVHQGSSVSGASVALSALIGRLDGLVEELVAAYNISEQELEDVIFHNEAYKNSNSSPEMTPERSRQYFVDKTPSPQKGSSFVSAVINAIKNAAQSPFSRDVSKDTISTERSSSNEMLDSETEPCLMMEHVLEDVVIPDGHSHNLISSGHGSLLSSRLTHSESLKDLSQALLSRQMTERASISFCVDQVIDVDNLITRLLKTIRIIQIENDECMQELQDQRDGLLEQIEKQKETNKVVVKQLKDWEMLGERLKTEVKELMIQMNKKNLEIDNLKAELNKHREEVEKLNQDVCELSTALAKTEHETKMKEEEVFEEIKKWERTGDLPSPDILGRLVVTQNEVLHSIQSVVQQCAPLSTLQRELEEVSFQSASALPVVLPSDCNANAAALMQAVANLKISATINTTA
nr:unnamed protein product [Callosobruchus analis]